MANEGLLGTAISSGLGVLGGLGQILTAGTKKKEKALEEQANKAPKYAGSQEIGQYYKMAQQQANTAAQQSALFKQNQQLQQRNLASGLAASNTTMGGQGLVSKLVQGANDASMKNLASAESQKERRMGALGQASQLMSADKMKQFQINQQQPWETKYNLLAAKAAQAAQQKQAGWSNIAGAAQTGAMALGSGGSKKRRWANDTADMFLDEE